MTFPCFATLSELFISNFPFFSLFLSTSSPCLKLSSHPSRNNKLSTLITETETTSNCKKIYPCCGSNMSYSCSSIYSLIPTVQKTNSVNARRLQRDSPSCNHKTGVSTGTKGDGARGSLNMSQRPEAGGRWAGPGVHTSPN